MGPLTRLTHDPNSTIDYVVNWKQWLGPDDYLTNSTWIVPVGITKTSEQFTTSYATIFIAGGATKHVYILTNRITTAAGRTEDHSFELKVVDK